MLLFAPTMSGMRVVYLAGAGDAFHTFREWKDGRPDAKSSHVTYSSQFYDVCRELGAGALVLCSNRNAPPEPLTNGSITLESRPDWLAGATRFRYQERQWAFARSVIADVERFGANVLVTQDQPHLFLYAGLRLRGVSIIQILPCVLWPTHAPRSATNRVVTSLLGLLYPNLCDAILTMSAEIDRQVEAVTRAARRQAPPIANYFPHYLPEMYGGLPPAERGPVVRFMFVGRVEADKGVFALLDIASRLRARGRHDIAFEICGSGTALDELRRRTAAENLEATFVIKGWCDRDKLREVYARSYAVVVPTTVQFVEGFNQVVVEALLAGRPVITSNVCPAVDYVAPAILQVPPDDVDAYERAIVQLADDVELHGRLRQACEPVCRKFLDESTNFRAALRHALTAVAARQPMTPRLLPAAP
jgi:glycosyltransferase involved in cell wall biosynthesis